MPACHCLGQNILKIVDLLFYFVVYLLFFLFYLENRNDAPNMQPGFTGYGHGL